ncbi:MAG: hypothetical protein LBC89_03230 [Bacteroidales bacterium]|jgi:hypothetical protein|nr:hypothetical protein [Bacteroidales bacterium]
MKRHALLTVLCILTFIGSGFSLLSNGIMGFFKTPIVEAMEHYKDTPDFDNVIEMLPNYETIYDSSLQILRDTHTAYYILNLLLVLLSLVGTAMMWKVKKLGFHLYTVSQLLMLFIPMMFGLAKFPSIWGLVFSGIFIGLYWLGLKKSQELQNTISFEE